jgi:hypothetical protein
MNKKYLIFAGAVFAALVIGSAYGNKIPLVSTVASKLPSARL